MPRRKEKKQQPKGVWQSVDPSLLRKKVTINPVYEEIITRSLKEQLINKARSEGYETGYSRGVGDATNNAFHDLSNVWGQVAQGLGMAEKYAETLAKMYQARVTTTKGATNEARVLRQHETSDR